MDIYTTDKNKDLCFNKDLFQHGMSEALGEPCLKIISAQKISSLFETNLEEAKYAKQPKKIIGLFHYEVIYQCNNKEHKVSLLIKSKISNKEFIEIGTNLLLKAGLPLEKSVFVNYLQKTCLGNSDSREIKLYQLALQNSQLGAFFPSIYGTYLNKAKDEYIILEGLLTGAYLIQDYQDISFWNKKNIINALKDLSSFHAIYYAKSEKLAAMNCLGGITSTQKMLELTPLWEAYAENLRSYEGNLFTTEDIKLYFNLLETLPLWWKKIDSLQKTLIYNDLQLRNLAMRNVSEKPQLCLFDWELATTHIPQRDLVEFLSYVIKENVTDSELGNYLEISRVALEKSVNKVIDKKDWLEGCLLALYDYQVERLSFQLIVHKVVNRPDIVRVWRSSRRLLKFFKKECI